MGGGPGGSMGGGPKVLQISIERDVQLHHTANAWKPPTHKTEEGEETTIEVCTTDMFSFYMQFLIMVHDTSFVSF